MSLVLQGFICFPFGAGRCILFAQTVHVPVMQVFDNTNILTEVTLRLCAILIQSFMSFRYLIL